MTEMKRPTDGDEFDESLLETPQVEALDDQVIEAEELAVEDTRKEAPVPTETGPDEPKDVVGVRFQRAGKIYYFSPAGLEIQVNDQVVVETERGLKVGRVVIAPKQVMASQLTEPLKPVLRLATPDDLERLNSARAKEREALSKCAELSARFGLPIKVISADCSLDCTYITVFFSAEGRVDFRQLVREMAASLKARVELRQVGPRDEAKMIGGIGRCGFPLCCASFLTEFSPLSIKMAKEQGLSLEPAKISGSCGRLLCCLGYEAEYYRAMKGKLPAVGRQVITPLGEGTVVGLNMIKETVTVRMESQATVEFPANKIVLKPVEQITKKGQQKSQTR